MSLCDKLFNQIKQLSTNITEENYCAYHEQGYDILICIALAVVHRTIER